MNLDIIAQLVQILKDAPELGAIEVRRGLLGRWSSIRVTKAGHGTNAGGQHVVVAQPAAVSPPAPGAQAAVAPPGVPAKSQLEEIKSPMGGSVYAAPQSGARHQVKAARRAEP